MEPSRRETWWSELKMWQWRWRRWDGPGSMGRWDQKPWCWARRNTGRMPGSGLGRDGHAGRWAGTRMQEEGAFAVLGDKLSLGPAGSMKWRHWVWLSAQESKQRLQNGKSSCGQGLPGNGRGLPPGSHPPSHGRQGKRCHKGRRAANAKDRVSQKDWSKMSQSRHVR